MFGLQTVSPGRLASINPPSEMPCPSSCHAPASQLLFVLLAQLVWILFQEAFQNPDCSSVLNVPTSPSPPPPMPLPLVRDLVLLPAIP